MNSSGSNLGKVTTSRPTADAWCVLEMDSNLKPNIVDSVGVSSAAYVQGGVLRVTFTNPERFANGAYVVLGQGELGNAGGYGMWVPQGTIQSTSSTATGLSGSCDISSIGFNVGSAISPTWFTDTPLSLRPRVNLAFFCLRSDNDIGKTGVINYGTDTANMTVFSPSPIGSFGGTVLIPGAGVAPDGTQTAVGVRVTPNSLGVPKSIQYSLPAQFHVASKTWNASIYIKAGDGGRVLRGASANVVFKDNESESSPSLLLNLDSGLTAFVPSSTYVSHSVNFVGNGWYRVNLSSKSDASGSNVGKKNFYIGLLSTFFNSSAFEAAWGGNGSIEAYLWGFQLEEGSVTTPYIPAVGAPLSNTQPVPGNQDLLTVYSLGGGGFGADNRQNLFRYSQDFSNAAWTKTRLGVCAGYVAPDGTTTAFKLHDNDTSSDPRDLSQNPIVFERGNIRQPYTFSFYAKADERKYVQIVDGFSGRFQNLVIDLQNGSISQNTGSIPVTVYPSGNGWWRISCVHPLANDNSDTVNINWIGLRPSFSIAPSPTETTASIYSGIYPGVSGSGILVWGAQLERGTVLGDYTRTVNTVAGTTYGRTAGNADSAIVNIRTRREATAYGTIVVPPRGAPYLENEYGVGNVRSVAPATYEVVFSPPMDTTSYCVITSNEKESLAPVEPTIPESAEFNMNMLRRVSSQDDQRTRAGFRVSTLRQAENANNPNLITIPSPTSLTQLPAPIVWGYEHTNTSVLASNETSLSGALRTQMNTISPYWVKCTKNNASTGRVAAGAPNGVSLVSEGIYRIMYYVVCDHPNFVSGSEIFWQSDNSASSEILSLGKYTFADKGSVRLIETVYRSVTGGNVQVLRTTATLPIGTTFYTTGIEVQRILQFEARPLPTREERINFMVFGGRAIRGSE